MPSTSEYSPQRIERVLVVDPPYDPLWMFGFLEKRAVPPYEIVRGLCYQRHFGDACYLEVEWLKGALHVRIPASLAQDVDMLVAKVRNLFDLDADSQRIDDRLCAEKSLQPFFHAGGGLRVPGGWTGFEVGIRAILGQQVSVARATTLVAALVEYYSPDGFSEGGSGAGSVSGSGDGSRLEQFPSPEQVASENPSRIGMPRKRGLAVQMLAQNVCDGALLLEPGADSQALKTQLRSIPGIGPWTAEYIAMRAARDADAFPEKDWVVLKNLGMDTKQVQITAEGWRPWRAYALMYIWRGIRTGKEE